MLNSLKTQVVYLASAANILPTVQNSAQVALQTGWSILLPTANGRARTLSSLLLNTGIHIISAININQALFLTSYFLQIYIFLILPLL